MNTLRQFDLDGTLNVATGAVIALLTSYGLIAAFVG